VATCSFSVWFIAEPTDAGSTYSAQNWEAWVQAMDASNATGTATNSSELNSLNALNVSDSITYGSLGPTQSNDPLDKLVKATTTGNTAIDANISGTDMCTDYATCAVNTTSITWQHYATTTPIGYSSTTAQGCYIASSTPALLEFITTKPTATPSDQGQSIYWGTYVPTGQALGTYTGLNTFTVTSD
jgi:hypothetical protein